MSPVAVLAAIFASASALMSLVFVVSMRRKNLGIVDVAWSAMMGLSAIAAGASGTGGSAARALVALLGGLWATRLFLHLRHRVASEVEDGRYQAMRVRLGTRTLSYFAFFQMQAVSVGLFAVPFIAAATNPSPTNAGLAVAVVVALVAIGGESVADRQLARHRADPSRRGTTCREGLWSWSRHPNYFFEWLHWFAYPAIAFGGPGFPFALLGPVLMGFFLYRVSGIPWVEAQALRSRGHDYRRYQREVSAFFPLPPRST